MSEITDFYGSEILDCGRMGCDIVRTCTCFGGTYRLHLYATPQLFTLGGLVVIALATGIKIREFKPGRGRRIFTGHKTVARLLSEVK
jgi:hypothetical protein